MELFPFAFRRATILSVEVNVKFCEKTLNLSSDFSVDFSVIPTEILCANKTSKEKIT